MQYPKLMDGKELRDYERRNNAYYLDENKTYLRTWYSYNKVLCGIIGSTRKFM
jgi:hypothetical protein